MILGIYGRQDSGKTKLVEALVGELSKEFRVATVKHVSEAGWSIDAEGKDTWRHAMAGASPVVAAGENETSYIFKPAQALSEVFARLDADIILVEGFKDSCIPKVAVGDIPETPGTVMRFTGDPAPVLAYVRKEAAAERKASSLNTGVSVTVGDEEIPLTKFPAEVVKGVVEGLVSSLKGGKAEGEIVVRIARAGQAKSR